MSVKRRSAWLRINLRTLILACTAAAVGLGWWFMPFVRETRREDGSLRTRFELRRAWHGPVVSYGKQAWYMPDGTSIVHIDYGTPYENDFMSILAKKSDFDPLIWLITETINPESWSEPVPGRVNLNVLIDP
jgi:hypothetical protein